LGATATVAVGGKGDTHIAARFDQTLGPANLQKVLMAFRAKYGNNVVYEENTADPAVAHDLRSVPSMLYWRQFLVSLFLLA